MRLFLALLLLASSAYALPQEKSIDFSGAGPTTLIAAISGKTIKVTGIWLTSNIDTTFYLSSNSVAKSGPITIWAGGGHVLFAPAGFFIYTFITGYEVKITQSGTAQLSGVIYYTQD